MRSTMSIHPAISPLRRWGLLAILSSLLLLSGCEMLGLETPGMVAQRQAAEARAVGAACRHAVRSIEDCFATNPRMSRAEIFEGWREMDQHMRDNDIPGMPQQPAAAPASPTEQMLPVAPAAAAAPAASPAVAPRAPGTPAAAGVAPVTPAPSPAQRPAAPSTPGGATPGTIALPPRPGLTTPPAPAPAAAPGTAPAAPAR